MYKNDPMSLIFYTANQCSFLNLKVKCVYDTILFNLLILQSRYITNTCFNNFSNILIHYL